MQRIDDDMDNLFREAAENYSLKTPPGEWENIAAKLAGNAPKTALPKRRRYRFLLLFLIIITSGLGAFLALQKPETTSKNSLTAAKSFDESHTSKHSETVRNNAGTVSADTITPVNAALPISIAKQLSQKDRARMFPLHSVAGKQSSIGGKRNATPSLRAGKNERAFSSHPPPVVSLNSETPAGTSRAYSITTNSDRDEKTLANQSSIAAANEVTPTSKAKTENTGQSDSMTTNDATVKTIKSSPKKSGKYIGVLAGMEWNQVKSQGMEKPGVDVGFATGFGFGKRLAFETGILLSRKNYYSNGKYFNPKPDTSAPAMEVLSLAGSATVLCIPLELRYNFVDARKAQLYFSGGINSYVLFFEKNHYTLMVSGAPQSMVKSYKEVKLYPLAALNMAMGMEYSAGQKLKLRVEPALQIPFCGIGIGRMPMTSFGINIGLLTRLP